MSRESGNSGISGSIGPAGNSGGGRSGGDGSRSSSENWMAGRTCFRCGDPDHFRNFSEDYQDAKRRGIPFVPPPQAEAKRLEELAEKRKFEDERDARLMRMVREEVFREKEKYEGASTARRIVKIIKTNERGETSKEEKERLRRLIATAEADEEELEDDELLRLRRRAAGLSLNDKRKRGKETVVGDNPPMIIPTKGQRTGMSCGAKSRISKICADRGVGAGCSTSILEPVGKISLSLKHVTVGTGPDDKEKYEAECRELFEALAVDELKDACKADRVVYGKREIAISRLVKRRVVKAYDPVNVALPVSSRVGLRRSGRTARTTEDDADKDNEEASE
ncbi:hypothetical protein CBR_g2929 [Chara braunii]|uniref:CCHC-type domain-containing protein n=1 Tax=Chara braunii TaxID=69332 RepID=A0A388KEF6_CHABU|nr:hypothetical protein CBR_g2929 [Chara braunii]|eukprot:GBG68386.1 hypothetical protein CBR_g2929 [Chara braunii]